MLQVRRPHLDRGIAHADFRHDVSAHHRAVPPRKPSPGDVDHGQVGQDGVAELVVGGGTVYQAHVQPPGEPRPHVHRPGQRPAAADLLQGHDIRMLRLEDPGDRLGVELPVDAHCLVDVVADQSEGAVPGRRFPHAHDRGGEGQHEWNHTGDDSDARSGDGSPYRPCRLLGRRRTAQREHPEQQPGRRRENPVGEREGQLVVDLVRQQHGHEEKARRARPDSGTRERGWTLRL